MHTITLKSDDNFYEMLNNMVKNLSTTKSDLIRKAVVHYRDVLEKEKLKKQIKNASMKTRESSMQIIKEFDNTLCDGLNNV
jgi:predicted DNA-binding protein